MKPHFPENISVSEGEEGGGLYLQMINRFFRTTGFHYVGYLLCRQITKAGSSTTEKLHIFSVSACVCVFVYPRVEG